MNDMFLNGMYCDGITCSGGVGDAIVHVILWVLFIMLIIWIVRSLVGGPYHGGRRRGRWMGYDHMSAIELLRERYAKGEITKEQFESMKKDLE